MTPQESNVYRKSKKSTTDSMGVAPKEIIFRSQEVFRTSTIIHQNTFRKFHQWV